MKRMTKIGIYGMAVWMLSACGNGTPDYDATGTFEATEVIVSAEAAGKLLQLEVEEGTRLKAGEEVGLVDTVQLYLKKLQLEASMKSVESQRPDLAKQIAAAKEEGQQLGLTADELAFYDALTKPQAIKDFYENEELIAITKELADTLRKNKTVDWQKRDSARAKMRMLIKKLLKRHKYPPEGMDDAVQTVMTQCELWTDTNDMRENEDDKGYRVDMSDKLLMVAKKQENGYGIKI